MPILSNLEDVALRLNAFAAAINGKAGKASTVQALRVEGTRMIATMANGTVVEQATLPSSTELLLTWDHAATVWRLPGGAALTADNLPDWAAYDRIVADAASALTADELDNSLLPEYVKPSVTMEVAAAANPITVTGGGGGTATMTPIPYDQLRIV